MFILFPQKVSLWAQQIETWSSFNLFSIKQKVTDVFIVDVIPFSLKWVEKIYAVYNLSQVQ